MTEEPWSPVPRDELRRASTEALLEPIREDIVRLIESLPWLHRLLLRCVIRLDRLVRWRP